MLGGAYAGQNACHVKHPNALKRKGPGGCRRAPQKASSNVPPQWLKCSEGIVHFQGMTRVKQGHIVGHIKQLSSLSILGLREVGRMPRSTEVAASSTAERPTAPASAPMLKREMPTKTTTTNVL